MGLVYRGHLGSSNGPRGRAGTNQDMDLGCFLLPAQAVASEVGG